MQLHKTYQIFLNSEFKAFFNLEEENVKVLEKYTSLSETEALEIKSLKRGENIMFVGKEHIRTFIESAEYERKILGGD